MQYNESHLDFIQRLLAEEGIFYYFRHEEGKHSLVLTDLTQGSTPLEPNPLVEYHHASGGMIKRQFVSQFNWREVLRSNHVTQRDYCFTKPFYDQEHRSLLSTTHDGVNTPDYGRYDFHARYKEPAQGIPFTDYHLQAERADASQGRGIGNLIHFSAGVKFALNSYPIDFNNREYLLVSVSHTGTQPQVLEEASGEGATHYENSFSVIPDSTVSWRAPLWPKPVIHGSQMALVVGPENEEIYTDEYGRVKLHFPWDRYSKKDENSSCWIRVSQAWAGKNWGFMSVPRIGHEVIVDFIEGDPDQPIVIGRTYHAANPHPYPLPANKTQTGIKSRSSKGGNASNFNEIRFEDLKDQEQVYIHAEKNQDNIVEHDETTDVGHNRTENIGHDETIQIGNDRKEDVGNDETISIGNDRRENVGNNEVINIGHDQQTRIGHDQKRNIGNNRSSVIGKDDIVKIDNHKKLDVVGNQSIQTGGHLTHEVGGKSHLKAGEKISNRTTKFVLNAMDEAKFASSGATLVFDNAGITFKGKVTIKGNLSISGGGGGGAMQFLATINEGEPICEICEQMKNQ